LGKLTRRILLGLLLGVLVYAALGMLTDVRQVLDHASRFPVGVVFGALGLTLVNYALRFLKWHLYLEKLGFEVPTGESATVFVAGMVMAVTPGKVGEVFKSFLLRQSREIPVASTAPIVVAERMTDLLGMVLIAALGVASFQYGRTVFAVTVVLLVVGIVILNQREWVLSWLAWSEKLPVVGRFHDKLEEAYRSMHTLVDLPILFGTTLISAVAWSMEGLALYWILVALEADGVTLYATFFVYAITQIAGALSFLPGGLGVTEGGIIFLLTDVLAYFENASPATLATYLIRFATLWFGVLAGALALGLFQVRYGEVETPEDDELEGE
jgi:uncharacterized protein (TIRG00374 family)